MIGFLKKKLFLDTYNRKLIFKNVSWSVIGKMVQVLNALLIGVVVARYLKPQNYGVLNYVTGYIAMFPLLTEFGLSSILIREFSKKSTDRGTLMGTAIGMRLVYSVVTIAIIYVSLLFFEKNAQLRTYIVISSFNFLFLSLAMTVRDFLNGQLKNDYIVKSEIFRVSILAIAKITCILLKAPLFVFIIFTAIDAAVILIILIPLYFRKFGDLKDIKFKFPVVRTLSKSSFPLFIDGIAGVFYQKIDVVFTGKLINTESVAYYAVALKFVDFAIFIPLAFVQALSPLLVQKLESVHYNIHNEEYIKFKRKLGDVVTYSGIIVSMLLFITASPIIYILYGADYSKSIIVLQILAWKGVFCGLGYSASAMIITEGRQKYSYVTNIIGGAFNVALSFLLIPRFGLIGVALSTIISFSIGTYFSNYFLPLYKVDFKFQTDFLFKGPSRLLTYLKTGIKN